MAKTEVLYRTEGNVAVITLNRPEAKNAFSNDMIGLWREIWKRPGSTTR